MFTKIVVTRADVRVEKTGNGETPISRAWHLTLYADHVNHGMLRDIPIAQVPQLLTLFPGVREIAVPDRFAAEWLNRKGFRNLKLL